MNNTVTNKTIMDHPKLILLDVYETLLDMSEIEKRVKYNDAEQTGLYNLVRAFYAI